MTLEELLRRDGQSCPCGRAHSALLKEAVIESGAVRATGPVAKRLCPKPSPSAFLLADANTWKAAGEQTCASLENAGFRCTVFVLPAQRPEPDERTLGSFLMHCPPPCDLVVAVGSGVVNDNAKLLAAMGRLPLIVVGTAPSMDGYASATSSMARDGAKVSLPSKCPDAVIGDLDVLCAAPLRMIQAGLGDMLAKYVSLCEWRIGALLCDEYYCERTASLVRDSLQKCVSHADGVVRRDPAAVAAVMEGMCLAGVAANYAGVSRPVSGTEHYISHLWDMRGLALGTPTDLHGIQVGVCTLLTVQAYQSVKVLRPDREKALRYVRSFSFERWSETLRDLLGSGAQPLIDGEYRERKYDLEKHAARLTRILTHWEDIQRIIAEEIPSPETVRGILRVTGAPETPGELGFDDDLVRTCFIASKDIRDKYVLPRLLWDLGVLEETAQGLLPAASSSKA